MKKALWVLLLLLSFATQAQVLTTTTPYDLTSTIGSPMSLPIRFDLSGRISFSLAKGDSTVFPLMGHFGWERQHYNFIPALAGVRDYWEEAGPEVRQIHVRRMKIEGGAGIGFATKLLTGNVGVSIGLVPFKGGSWEARTFKKPTDGYYSLPLSAAAWEEWDIGEGRDYQVYGGMTFSLGLAALGVNVAQVFTTAQNRWQLSLEKVSSQHLRVRIRQDNWRKIGRVFGPAVANWEAAALKYFDQERAYLVDMTSDAGIEAVKALWAGRMIDMQSSAAAQEEQSMRYWEGTYRARYLGVPYIFGQTTARVELNSWEVAGDGRALGLLNMQVRNSGIFREADPQVWTVVHDPTDETLYFLAVSQSLEKGSWGVRKRLGQWMERMGWMMDWPVLKTKDFLDGRLMFAVSMKSWERWGELDVSVEEYQMVCATVALKCQRERLAKKAVKRWNELKALVAEKRVLPMAEFLIRHPLMWRQLVVKAKERMSAEFMAHGDRFMPLRRTLITP